MWGRGLARDGYYEMTRNGQSLTALTLWHYSLFMYYGMHTEVLRSKWPIFLRNGYTVSLRRFNMDFRYELLYQFLHISVPLNQK